MFRNKKPSRKPPKTRAELVHYSRGHLFIGGDEIEVPSPSKLLQILLALILGVGKKKGCVTMRSLFYGVNLIQNLVEGFSKRE